MSVGAPTPYYRIRMPLATHQSSITALYVPPSVHVPDTWREDHRPRRCVCCADAHQRRGITAAQCCAAAASRAQQRSSVICARARAVQAARGARKIVQREIRAIFSLFALFFFSLILHRSPPALPPSSTPIIVHDCPPALSPVVRPPRQYFITSHCSSIYAVLPCPDATRSQHHRQCPNLCSIYAHPCDQTRDVTRGGDMRGRNLRRACRDTRCAGERQRDTFAVLCAMRARLQRYAKSAA